MKQLILLFFPIFLTISLCAQTGNNPTEETGLDAASGACPCINLTSKIVSICSWDAKGDLDVKVTNHCYYRMDVLVCILTTKTNPWDCGLLVIPPDKTDDYGVCHAAGTTYKVFCRPDGSNAKFPNLNKK